MARLSIVAKPNRQPRCLDGSAEWRWPTCALSSNRAVLVCTARPPLDTLRRERNLSKGPTQRPHVFARGGRAIRSVSGKGSWFVGNHGESRGPATRNEF
jgi:hypothetical protein